MGSNVYLSRREVLLGVSALSRPLFAAPGTVPLRVQRPETLGFDSVKLGLAADAVKQLVERDGVPSAVFLVGRTSRPGVKASGIALRTVNGPSLVSGPDSPPDPISEDKLFDVASLTKVVALTTALAVLVDEGSLGLDSPVRHHLPQWGAHIEGVAQGKFVPTPSQPVPPAPATLATPGNNPSPSALPPLPYAAWNDKRELTTLRHLLTHTAGLPAGGAYAGKYVTLDQVVTDIARARPLSLPGRTFLYSDYSAILLGAVIESERSNLDLFCREAVFRPLRMDSTMYRPPLRELMRCAHTTPPDAPVPSPGLVHDPTARALGGVSGNAGLFSTADDLARFCLMWLSYGQIHDPAPNGPKRLLSEKTVREFTRAQIGYGEGKRALGWDMDSAFSIRGDFAPGSYGHTGYTGTSLWLDPQTGVFVVLLTNAVHGPETARQTLIKTRRVISSLVAASVVA